MNLQNQDLGPFPPGGTFEDLECSPFQKLTKVSPPAHGEPVTMVAPSDLEQLLARHSSPKKKDVIAAARLHLSVGGIQNLEELLAEYEDIFAVDSEDYGRNNREYHRIDMANARQIRLPPRSLPLATQTQVLEMLRRGVIEESVSPWSFLVLLTRKKNGEHRFCVG
jgi:hypothetical protein